MKGNNNIQLLRGGLVPSYTEGELRYHAITVTMRAQRDEL